MVDVGGSGASRRRHCLNLSCIWVTRLLHFKTGCVVRRVLQKASLVSPGNRMAGGSCRGSVASVLELVGRVSRWKERVVKPRNHGIHSHGR